jgi:hypothetical protein
MIYTLPVNRQQYQHVAGKCPSAFSISAQFLSTLSLMQSPLNHKTA